MPATWYPTTPARVDVARVERSAKQQSLAFGRRQQPVSIFMVVVLPQPFEPTKPKDLAAFNGEAHPIDGGKVAGTGRSDRER